MVQDLFGFNAIPETVHDENNDVHRVEKYFNQTGWYATVENFHKKREKLLDVPCLSQAHL